MMNQFGDEMEFRISIPKDEKGFVGRECPNQECLGYFKIKLGTGLTGENLPCHCPYCGHSGDQNTFFTQAQIEYAKSIAFNQVTTALLGELKKLEFDHRPSGGFGIGMSMKVLGEPHPIQYYREQELETNVTCDSCTLDYAIYGVFAFCPDCGIHNSLQILSKNLELAAKKIALAQKQDDELKEQIIGDALANVVSALDGFGRKACQVAASSASDPTKADNVSFQNLEAAQRKVQELFGFDLANSVTSDDWTFAKRAFAKRHLIAHKAGVVDTKYIAEANDPHAVLGRKVTLTSSEVERLIDIVRQVGKYLFDNLQSIPKT